MRINSCCILTVSIDRSEKRFGLLVILIHIVDGRGNLLNHGVFSFFLSAIMVHFMIDTIVLTVMKNVLVWLSKIYVFSLYISHTYS